MKKKIWLPVLCLIMSLFLLRGGIDGVGVPVSAKSSESKTKTEKTEDFSLSQVPDYEEKSEPYTIIHDNKPFFTEEDLTTSAFERYSDLDELDRCGVAYANLCRELMPTRKRGAIGSVKPSGWHTIKYNDLIDGNYLYNRCHLIGYQLAGENANEKNLITGTRYLNTEGMLPFENMIADYIEETDHHVLYRVTPVYDGDNLVASGVLMEAESVEDQGEGILFNVYCYNVQPGISIDYATGDSEIDESYEAKSSETSGKKSSSDSETGSDQKNSQTDSSKNTSYVVNTNTGKFHDPSCSSAKDIHDSNRMDYRGSREELISQGYVPCKRCKP